MSAKKSDDEAVHPFIRQQFSFTVLGYLRSKKKRSLLDIPENLQNLTLKFYAFIHQLRMSDVHSENDRDGEEWNKEYQDSVLQLVRLNCPATRYKIYSSKLLYSWYFEVPNDVGYLHFHVIGLGKSKSDLYENASKAKTKPDRFNGKLTYRTSALNSNWNGLRFDLKVPERKLVMTSWIGIASASTCKKIRFDVDTTHDATHSYGLDILLKRSQSSYIVADFAMSMESTEIFITRKRADE